MPEGRATLTTVGKIRADRVRQNHIIRVDGDAWWLVTEEPTFDERSAVRFTGQRVSVIRRDGGGTVTQNQTHDFVESTWALIDIQCDSPSFVIVGMPGV